jgi:predicted homoserine dehydrogenase-like protein
MNLYRLLNERKSARRPLGVGLIGAGKFGSMYLAQAQTTPGIHIAGIADLQPQRARNSCLKVGFAPESLGAPSLDVARQKGTTWIGEDALELIASDAIEVVIDATGSPTAGIRHVRACCREGKHIVMVNVEADVLAGPALAREAAAAGVVYSLAYGDQPALICELVDWARAAGFTVVAAGKGTKYLPIYHSSTPDQVWGYYGFTEKQVAEGDFNAQMFNSFLDGTKSALEMAAVANATCLEPPEDGLAFPPCGADDLPHVMRPREAGGRLERAGLVEVVSSLERDGRPVYRDLRWGVYVTFTTENPYSRECFPQYGLPRDDTGRYSALYRPAHLIGMELGISVASVALRREATGQAQTFMADVVACAKRDLHPGEILDGEGGYRVYGKLYPARKSLSGGFLPIGLAHGLELNKTIPAGQPLTWEDVIIKGASEAVSYRWAMETHFCRLWGLKDQLSRETEK